VAENDARLRQANENISRVAEDVSVDWIPFVCECADLGCQEIVYVSRAAYEEIRSDGRRFLNAPNHVAAARGWARLVERRDGYDVVEKLGEAGEITEHLDPRGGAEWMIGHSESPPTRRSPDRSMRS
jgi:hypothetical protein